MPFLKIDAEKLSQSVVQQIELLILRGILHPGERLPSERELSERMGVSRPSLREAVADLQARGLLASRPNAGIFVAEVLSVMLQVGWFKYTKKKYGTGRRIFKMAPLHHHFEKSGWQESQVVVRFWIITMLLCLVGLASLKLR